MFDFSSFRSTFGHLFSIFFSLQENRINYLFCFGNIVQLFIFELYFFSKGKCGEQKKYTTDFVFILWLKDFMWFFLLDYSVDWERKHIVVIMLLKFSISFSFSSLFVCFWNVNEIFEPIKIFSFCFGTFLLEINWEIF